MTNPDHLDDSLAAVRKARELLHRARAVIFDFDGLLVDTEYAIYSSWERVFASCGHALPLDLFNQCLGSGYTHWNPGEHLEQLTGRTFDWEAVNGRRQEEIVRDLEHAGLLPGACELIRSLAEAGTPMGVASSSSHRSVTSSCLSWLLIFPMMSDLMMSVGSKSNPRLLSTENTLNADCWLGVDTATKKQRWTRNAPNSQRRSVAPLKLTSSF